MRYNSEVLRGSGLVKRHKKRDSIMHNVDKQDNSRQSV